MTVRPACGIGARSLLQVIMTDNLVAGPLQATVANGALNVIANNLADE